MMRYIPYILLFAAAAAVIYAWGLWRSMRQQQDLSNLLSAKGVAKIKKALKRKGPMSAEELEEIVEGLTASQPFSRERIQVTDKKAFLSAILPYMIKQRMITEEKEGMVVKYRIRR